jgi:succinate dehydrogenase/fumarate reductase flavoprotein subunit
MKWDELLKARGVPEWPYPVRYGEEKEITADILVLGGGIAGCWAAKSAAQKGAKVAIVEKGATIRSGAGGSGCDHWLNTPNHLSTITPEEVVEWELASSGGYTNALSRYIAARESYETLLELEEMGGKIRDTEDEFQGAPFRDEETKFLFAYDYENRIHFRVWGSTFKPALYKECKRLGVEIHDRVMATNLLTQASGEGTRVVGAMGLNVRTGEFCIFKARAVIDCLSRHQRNWIFSSELRGMTSFRPPQIVGDGHAMAWRAGAEFTMMEKSIPSPVGSGSAYPPYGTGNPFNTWVPCTMVDAHGKEIPWVDRDGKVLKSIEERTKPASGQKFMGERTTAYEHKRPDLTPDLLERVKQGELVPPLYADLPSMPEHERRAIWGLMVGEEGKTRVPILDTYTQAGFDPKRDLLQSYLVLGGDPLRGAARGHERNGGELGDAGGLVVGWDLMTNLEGFYAAGDALFAANYHYHAAATGRYAGRKAAEYAAKVSDPTLSRKQVDEEKDRVYAPVKRETGIEWKELNMAIARVMQNYCGEYKNEELLNIGLIWLEDCEKNIVPQVYADNPHKLMRTLEVLDILACSQMIIHASIARKASSQYLSFFRLDYQDTDPPEWNKWVTIKLEEDKVTEGELSIDFWKPLKDNYEKYR